MPRPERISRRMHALGLALVAAAVLTAYLPPLLKGQAYYSQDTTDLNYVVLRSHVNDLKSHGFVAWSPGIGTGHYRAADPTYALYSPRVLLFFLFRGYGAQLAVILLYALWAGAGAYVLGAGLMRSWPAALFLGMAWPLSGPMAGMVYNVPYFTSAAWVPWALAAWTLTRPVARRIALSSICLAMVAVEGDPFGLGFTLALLGMTSLFTAKKTAAAKEAAVWAATGAAAVGLSAVVWMPALMVLPESRRAGGLGILEATAFSLNPLELIGLAAPRFFGQFMERSFWANDLTTSIQGHMFWHQSLYLGLAAPGLCLAALATGGRERRTAAGFMAAAAVFTLLAFGRHAPFFGWALSAFAPAVLFRYPAKLFTCGAFALLCAAAAGLSGLPRLLAQDLRRRVLALVLAAAYALALTALVRYAAASADKMLAWSPRPALSAWRVEEDLVRLAVVAAALPLLLYLAGTSALLRKSLPLLIALASGADLCLAPPAFLLIPRADFSRPSELVSAIKADGPGRIYVSDDVLDHTRAGPRRALVPDWAILDGLEYGIGTTASLSERVSGLDNKAMLKENAWALLRILAVNYVVCPLDQRPPWIEQAEAEGLLHEEAADPGTNLALDAAVPRFPVAFLTRAVAPAPSRGMAYRMALNETGRGASGPPVYLDLGEAVAGGAVVEPAPRPPAYALGFRGGGAPGRIISMDRPDGDRLEIEAELDRPGLLVVRDYLMRGWTAQMDGSEAPIYFADGISRGVFLPQGTHRVAFYFHAPGWAAGAIISAAVFLALASILIAGRLRRSREAPPE